MKVIGNANSKTLILASGSPRRRELLEKLGLSFITIPANVDEATRTVSPKAQVEELALRKAQAVYDQYDHHERSIIIGADTLVVKNEQVLGKPTDEADAMDMLSQLAGDVHEVYTGIALIDTDTKEQVTAHRCTKVKFKPVTFEQIERYVKTGEPMDKAGSYGIQGLGALFVDSIEGCYFNVVGLPLSLLGNLLTKFGVRVL